jgi:hypothetical protein
VGKKEQRKMILERKSRINIADIKERQEQLFQHFLQNPENEANESSLTKFVELMQKFSAMLLDCANTLADTEKTMQYIRENIEK